MASKVERLSSAEATVLRRLADSGSGVWDAGDSRPLWENRYWTLCLLNKLAGKGLVAEVETDRVYGITPDGLIMSSRY